MPRQPELTVFYVDDDPDDLIYFQEVLDGLGRPTCLFSLGQNMLNILNNPPPTPSIIFLDLNMPGKSGFDVLQEMNESGWYAGIPVIILSTSANPVHVIMAERRGARLFITKPPSMDGLRRAITFAIEEDWTKYKATGKEFLYDSQA